MSDRIQDHVRAQINAILRKGREPAAISFSHLGISKARGQSMDGNEFGKLTKTYMGMPYRVDFQQHDDVKVLDEDQARGAIRLALPDLGHATNEQAPVMGVVIGRALGKAQLCDIIQAWAESNPRDPLAVLLTDSVARYGRFE